MRPYAGIDPSTKTGVVQFNVFGEVLITEEVKLANGIYSSDSELLNYGKDIVNRITPGSLVGIEGFSYGSKGKGVSTQYAVGYSIRFALVAAGFEYVEITPSQVKKFSTGKGNTTKDNMTIPIYRLWNFEHKSDNVRDAFVLSKVVKALDDAKRADIQSYHKYQLEVIQALMK